MSRDSTSDMEPGPPQRDTDSNCLNEIDSKYSRERGFRRKSYVIGFSGTYRALKRFGGSCPHLPFTSGQVVIPPLHTQRTIMPRLRLQPALFQGEREP